MRHLSQAHRVGLLVPMEYHPSTRIDTETLFGGQA